MPITPPTQTPEKPPRPVLPRLSSRKKKPPRPRPDHCLNCGQPADGSFCAHCGQENKDHTVALRAVYKQGWPKTLVKFSLLGLGYVIPLALCLIGTALAALWLL